MKKIKIRIPATTANFGSGYDVFGAALKLYNEIEVEQLKIKNEKLKIEIIGAGKETLPKDEKNIVWQAMKKVFDTLHITHYTRLPKRSGGQALHIRLKNRIPLARGLGSSAAARIGGLVAANKICGNKLSDDEIIKIAAKLEGHPDNVVPAYFGGLCICNYDKKDVKYIKIKIPNDLKAVFCIPEFEISTNKARRILPKMVLHKDAVFNSSRVALFLAAITRKKYNLLSTAMEDKLHQPYRKALIPGMYNVFDAAKKSGAYGVCISGSGPTILAITDYRKSIIENVGKAMVNAFSKYKIKSRYIVCDFNNNGTKI